MNNRKSRPRHKNMNDGKYQDDKKEDHEENNNTTTRIWVCSWNMAAKEMFKFKTTYDGNKIPDDDQTQKFEQIVPTNYDLYIFGVQEGVSDTFFQYIGLYLKEFDVKRLPLYNTSGSNQNGKNHKKSLNKNANCFGVHGRGDGSFINTKFTGSYAAQSAVSCGITQGSKGAACVLLKIHSSTIAFLSTHMSSNSTDAKLEHFKILVNKCGDQLGCSGFDLLQQFHHIVWFGDLNYRITSLTADNVLRMMALGNLKNLWKADSLKTELKTKKKTAFKNFQEPIPRLDFYPTYKKKPNRQLDFDQNPKTLRSMSSSSQQSSLSQLDKIYTTKYKEPFYKGGLVQDRIPSFCDRVLYHSLDSDDNSLFPEVDTGVLNCVEFSYKKDQCNNYGAIPNILMGSDHSAIYCGLQLKSPRMFACPPDELTDQGLPKSYSLKIEDIKILKNSPYHSGSIYSEYPIKTRICFPVPYEIENFKFKQHEPFSYQILQQDLETYHTILQQIDMESKRRISRNNVAKKREKQKKKIKVTPLMTPQTSVKQVDNTLDNELPLNLMDPDPMTMSKSKTAPSIDQGLRSKKQKIKRYTHSIFDCIHSKVYKHSDDADDDDDMWHDEVPSLAVLTNIDDKLQMTNKGVRANSITSLQSKKTKSPKIKSKMLNGSEAIATSKHNHHSRHDSAPDVKNRQLPSDYIFKSEDSMESEKKQIKNKSVRGPRPRSPPPQPPSKKKFESGQISPKHSTTSPALNTNYNGNNNGNGGGFLFSFDYNNVHRFDLSKGNQQQFKFANGNKDDEEDENEWYRMPKGFKKVRSNPESMKKSLRSKIENDYFEEDEHEKNDMVSPIALISSPRSATPTLQRSRSKSMGSFAETIDKKTEMQHITSENSNVHKGMYDNEIDANKRSDHRISSAIYKKLAESTKKLTLITFGPSRRPTHGRIHCAIKVEAYDFKGQCCIAFEWTDFGKGVSNTQEVDLYYHGVPLYDKTGKPIKCKIKYKLSLIDTQISFDYD